MTYTESVERPLFDWDGFLAKEQKTEEEIKGAYRAANFWHSCAVGAQDSNVERHPFPSGQPLDPFLFDWGHKFNSCIFGGRFSDAKDYLQKIKDRAKVLTTPTTEVQ